MKFELSHEQIQRISAWKKELPKVEYTGALGGRFEYVFTPNGIGMGVTVRDLVLEKEIDVSDYENW